MFEIKPPDPLIIKEIKSLDNQGVHNFSFYSFDCYFRLYELVSKGQVQFIAPEILEIRGSKSNRKVFVFDYDKKQLQLLKVKQKEAVIYSMQKIPLEKESSFVEIAYDLDQVFDPASYPNSKKRHQRIRYPFIWLEKKNVKINQITAKTMLPAMIALHDKWKEKKKTDPSVYQIMFPSRRYIYCVERALANLNEYQIYTAHYKGELCAVRVIGTDKITGFDMSFFGQFWDMPSQMMNYIDIVILDRLKKTGMRYFNCGDALNKKLRTFKTHLPHSKVISYRYSKLKE